MKKKIRKFILTTVFILNACSIYGMQPKDSERNGSLDVSEFDLLHILKYVPELRFKTSDSVLDTIKGLCRLRLVNKQFHNILTSTNIGLILKEAGVDVNQVSDYGSTPLHWAAGNGHADVTKILISAGSEINRINIFGYTPLQRASKYGHNEIVEILLCAGADINQAKEPQDTPLWLSAVRWRKDIVEMLLRVGAIVPEDLKPVLKEMGFKVD